VWKVATCVSRHHVKWHAPPTTCAKRSRATTTG
jgi:hypothetical protein